MAITTIRKRSELSTVSVLAPERYDPRRSVESEGTLLGDVARLVRQTVQPSDDPLECLVLDTCDAREGIVVSRSRPTGGRGIGSAKKIIQPNDVIVSRLRPYLRQVAFVDDRIRHARGIKILCSTEFYVLRSPNERSIAFLVPFLLSEKVQSVFAASQEGGHHPRFGDDTLLTLKVPEGVLERRDETSRMIEESIFYYRKCEVAISGAIREADNAAPD